jgi:hypothetical protein
MTPQLWIQFLSFQDWKLTHPNLTDEDAILLYKAELQLFQNYQDEIRNQTRNRQARLTGDLLNLSTDISSILTEGGAGFRYTANYIGFKGRVDITPTIGVGAFVGTGTHLFRVGDLFSFNRESAANSQNGIYEVLVETNQAQETNHATAIVRFIIGKSSNLWKQVATLDGIPI